MDMDLGKNNDLMIKCANVERSEIPPLRE